MKFCAFLWLFRLGSGDDVDFRPLVLFEMTVGRIDRRGWGDLLSFSVWLPPLRLFALAVPGIDHPRQVVHRKNVHSGLPIVLSATNAHGFIAGV